MSLLLESIRIVHNRCPLLPYHLHRIDKTYKHLFSTSAKLEDIKSSIEKAALSARNDTVYKLRLLYNRNDWHIEIIPYTMRQISNCQCVYDDTVEYDFKFADRRQLEQLSAQHDDADDILIIKNGCVTDSSYANVAFYDGREWATPATPLLEGTRRAELLDNKKIVKKDITVREIVEYQKVSLFNAMINLEEITFSTQNIIL
ncbi:MAG: hypothetical protein HKN09_01100 [Saprospiraceae bacterium]|nr:hypothetical protein [Saprospiraceae bacterium]